MAGVFQAGDFPKSKRAELGIAPDLECIQSMIGTVYAEGGREVRYDFEDGTQVLYDRGEWTVLCGPWES